LKSSLRPYTAIGPVGLELIVERRNAEHTAHVTDSGEDAGDDVEVVTPKRERIGPVG
jgi:hypothetical protein